MLVDAAERGATLTLARSSSGMEALLSGKTLSMPAEVAGYVNAFLASLHEEWNVLDCRTCIVEARVLPWPGGVDIEPRIIQQGPKDP